MPSTSTLANATQVFHEAMFPGLRPADVTNVVTTVTGGAIATLSYTLFGNNYIVTYLGTNLQALSGNDFFGTINQVSYASAAAPGVTLATLIPSSPVLISSARASTDQTFMTGGDIVNGGTGNDFIAAGAGGNTQIFGGGGFNYITFTGSHNFTGGVISGGGQLVGSGAELIFTANLSGAAANFNLRPAAVSGIEHIQLIGNSGPVSVTIGSTQLRNLGGGIANSMILDLIGANTTFTVIDTVNPILSSSITLTDVLVNTAGSPSGSIVIDASLSTGGRSVYAPMGTTPTFIVTGSGDDFVFGGAGFDNIVTGAGQDRIASGAGDDFLNGGADSDILDGGSGNDTVFYSFSIGGVSVTLTDIVNGRSSGYATSADGVDILIDIENVFGSNDTDTLAGNSSANVLVGGGGSDVLNGGGGADTLTGGTGNDIYYIDNVGDTVTDLANEGFDIVISSISTSLTSNTEQLVLNGGATVGNGNGLANILYGLESGLALTLNGLNGDDVIYGSAAGGNFLVGGQGVDTLLGYGGNNTMRGGTESDIYYTYTNTDVLSEAGGSGIDTVYANYTITVGEGLEQIIVYGASGGATSTSLTDNNIIYGNSANGAVGLDGGGGADVLFGGAFSDTLIGGDGVDYLFGYGGTNTLNGGNDTDVYYSESATDVIVEGATGGFDTLYSQVNVTNLAANVEQLILYGAATSGTGNGQANFLYGNIASAAVTLNGGGGADYVYGSAFGDTLTGGTGNDQLDLRAGGDDTLVFAAGSGADVVFGFDSDPAGGQDLLNLAGRGFSPASIGGAITIAASGADTLITIGPDTIRLFGVAASTISSSDFTF
jgi:Ca2+-binding RTX toxin-like protein